MVDTLTLVLAAVLGFMLAGLGAKSRGLLPGWIRLSGPIVTLHTERGKALLDWLARPKRFWRAWGNLGVGIALVVMAGSFVLVLLGGIQSINNPQPTQLTQPRNVLAIPGVNDFLPLSAAPEIIAALLVGLVVHEGGHGLLSRVEDIEVDSMGLALFTFIPVGAFVEPDDEQRANASRGAQTRMFAAGVTNNFAVAIVAFALLFGPVAGSIAVVSGAPIAGVLPGGAAAQGGVDRGDVITSVDGTQVANASEFDALLDSTDQRTTSITLESGETATIERSLTVVGAATNAPFDINTTITSVNGTAVYTEPGFTEALRTREVATLENAAGETVTTPIGAYTNVSAPGDPGPSPLADATDLGGETFVITTVDGERVLDSATLGAILDETSAGQSITVVGYHDGQRRTAEVRLAAHPREDTGFLGVTIQPGITGMSVDDFGVEGYPAQFFLTAIGGGNGDSLNSIQRAAFTISLPFAAVTLPSVEQPFPGFVGIYENFYVVGDGPLAFLGTGPLLLLGTLLFWIAWINVILGQFNCVPAFPLDGGHILRTSTQAVVSRLPLSDKYAATRAVTVSIGLAMLVSLLATIFAPQLLS
ncbi:MAG: site-2 protease family protein [Halobacteriales archaeon]|nr:site-2 protease family protein [Halobacteriales archaeon]